MKDVIIIGGGPAGMMCAYQLEKSKVDYLLIEKNDSLGKKLLITGNGRCNVTNNRSVEEFISDLTLKNPKFLYSALYTFGPDQVLSFLSEHNIDVVLENEIKYFPKNANARTILNIFQANIPKSKVKYGHNVQEITYKDGVYEVLVGSHVYKAENVVVATGSKSFPKTGSTGDGLKFASSFKVKYHDFAPAETHVYSNQSVRDMGDLKGVSYPKVTVSIVDTKIQYTHDILFTHKGLSGPVIYHLSEYIYEELVKGNRKISINFINRDFSDVVMEIKNVNEGLLQYLRKYVTKKHSVRILEILKINKMKTSQLISNEVEKIAGYLTKYEVLIDRVEDVNNSYVNKGGIHTKELNPSSLEVKKQKGLYFIGETADIHGPIGGYNVTIAFSTGYLSALDIIEKLEK